MGAAQNMKMRWFDEYQTRQWHNIIWILPGEDNDVERAQCGGDLFRSWGFRQSDSRKVNIWSQPWSFHVSTETLWDPVGPCEGWLWNSWVKLSCELPEFPTAESTHQPLKGSGPYAGVPNRLCFWCPFFSQHTCQFQDTNTESKWKELTAEPIKADAF